MPYLSNIDVFLSIANESYATMQEAVIAGRTPKPDSSGHIIALDATLSSFKHACIVVAFSAMYFEALVYLISLERFGKTKATEIDRWLYEDRLKFLGVSDQVLLDMAKEFRSSRKALLHEKAVKLGQPVEPAPRFAQDMAEEAIRFVTALKGQLVAV